MPKAEQLELIQVAPDPYRHNPEADRPHRQRKDKPMPESKPRQSKGFDSGITPTVTAFVEVYTPGGNARGFREYFRLRYWDKFAGRWRHKHIKGGSTSSPLAQQRAASIKQAIKEGRSPLWLVSLCG